MATSGIPDLTSRQLQTILAVAEYGSFIAAAALMKTSQPAVTRTVKHVEDVLGVKLFDRSTRSVAITAAGKEFVAVAGRMLNDLRITIRSMRELSDQRRGQVIISSIMSVANGKLPGLVSAYRLEYPGVELHVRDGVHGTVIEDVRSGTADFGITYLDELPEPFMSVSVGREEFTVVLPRSHELARKTSLSLSDLRGAPLVSLPSDSRTRRVIDGAASAAGLVPELCGHRVAVRHHAGLRTCRHRARDRAEERRHEFPGQGVERCCDPRPSGAARPRHHHPQGARAFARRRRTDVADQAIVGPASPIVGRLICRRGFRFMLFTY